MWGSEPQSFLKETEIWLICSMPMDFFNFYFYFLGGESTCMGA